MQTASGESAHRSDRRKDDYDAVGHRWHSPIMCIDNNNRFFYLLCGYDAGKNVLSTYKKLNSTAATNEAQKNQRRPNEAKSENAITATASPEHRMNRRKNHLPRISFELVFIPVFFSFSIFLNGFL